MKKVRIVLLTLILCLSLCACGGGSNTEPTTAVKDTTPLLNTASEYLGTWIFVYGDENGKLIRSEELKDHYDDLLNEFGIIIAENGTACQFTYGDVNLGKWQISDDGILLDGTLPCTIVDGNLCVTLDEKNIYFAKISEDQTFLDPQEASQKTEDFYGTWIFTAGEQGGTIVTSQEVKSEYTDLSNEFGLVITADGETAMFDHGSVNIYNWKNTSEGFLIDGFIPAEIVDGKVSFVVDDTKFYFSKISDLQNIPDATQPESTGTTEVTTELVEENKTEVPTEVSTEAAPTESLSTAPTTPEPIGDITVNNSEEFRRILSGEADDSECAAFVRKYAGRNIVFKGSIDYCDFHGDYNTRFDYLLSGGDYNENSQVGPTFKFEDVNYLDLHTSIPEVTVGLNVMITAEIESFDINTGIFYLDPVSLTAR